MPTRHRPMFPKGTRSRVFKRNLRIGLFLGGIGMAIGFGAMLPKPAHVRADIALNPPSYLNKPPLVLASTFGTKPSDQRYFEVPEGSSLTLRFDAQENESAPSVSFDNEPANFTKENGAWIATLPLTKPTGLAPALLRLAQDNKTIGQWQINVQKQSDPKITLTDPPAQTNAAALRLSFEAQGASPIKEVRAEIVPTSPEAQNQTSAIVLATPDATKTAQTLFLDLSNQPLAGKPVSLRLVATDQLGHEGESKSVALVLPERHFKNPLAHALMEERAKLLRSPDPLTRDAIANLMASLARQQGDAGSDPLIILALRSSAVRLVLNAAPETPAIVGDMLWHVASRIEDGSVGIALRKIRDINISLSDALARTNNDAEVDMLLATSHEALAFYLDALIARAVPEPPELGGKEPLFEAQKTLLGQDELHGRIEAMRVLAYRGDRDAVRKELASWQNTVENLTVAQQPLSNEQRQALQAVVALRALAQDQLKLREQTTLNAKAKSHDAKKLMAKQKELIKKLQNVVATLPSSALAKDTGTDASSVAMMRAADLLERNEWKAAIEHQAVAALSLRKAVQTLVERIRTIVVAQPENKDN